jgi:uncharacterized protein YbjT (DUF2867 family)
MQTQPILIIGATGKIGSRRAALLFDWKAPETWPAALDGVASAYVTYFPDLAFPGAVKKVEALASVAKTAGGGRLVLLSGRGEHHARLGEDVVRRPGVDFTLIRSAWFAQNFSEGYLREPVLAGVLPMPGGDVQEPIIDVDDIAGVAVAVLTEDRHSGELYEITGPRLMTFAQMADALSSATRRTIQNIPITFEDFHAEIAKGGVDFVADLFVVIARETLDGRNAHVTAGLERALGRAPRDFADFARAAAQAGDMDGGSLMQVRRQEARSVHGSSSTP